jgi:malate synthase
MLDEELDAIRGEIGAQRYDNGNFPLASELFTRVAKAEPFVDFLTLPAYEYL